jgi:hypothetical protein
MSPNHRILKLTSAIPINVNLQPTEVISVVYLAQKYANTVGGFVLTDRLWNQIYCPKCYITRWIPSWESDAPKCLKCGSIMIFYNTPF